MNEWMTVGLIYGVVGFIILGQAVGLTNTWEAVLRPRQDQISQSAIATSLFVQRFDARWGLVFLVIGFVLQAAGAAGVASGGGVWLFLDLLPFPLCTYLACRQQTRAEVPHWLRSERRTPVSEIVPVQVTSTMPAWQIPKRQRAHPVRTPVRKFFGMLPW